MPSTIVYCEKCGKLIPPSEVARNKAVVFGDGGVCPDCVSGMTPAELRQIRSRFPNAPTSPSPPRRAGPGPVGGPRPLPRPASAGAGAARGSRGGAGIAAFAVAVLVGLAKNANLAGRVADRDPRAEVVDVQADVAVGMRDRGKLHRRPIRFMLAAARSCERSVACRVARCHRIL